MHTPQQVIVIGAGIVGASIAFHLSRRGVKVTVLDAREPGRGASSVSFAWINSRDKDPRGYHDLNRRSVDMWPRFERRLGGDIGLNWGGELRWAATEEGAADFNERVRLLQSWGYPIRRISAEKLRRLEPEIQTGDVSSASYTDIEGHVDTAKVMEAALAHIQKRGCEVLTGLRVDGFQLAREGEGTARVEAVATDDGEMTTDAVVVANGTGATALAAAAGLRLPQRHSPGATVITDPIEPVLRNVAAVHTPRDLPGVLMNFRQFADGRFMVHGGTHDGSLGDRSSEEAETLLLEASRFIPALREASVGEIRRALRPMPEDGFPVLGFARDVPNLYFAVTHSGVTLAPLIGEFATTEIMDGARIDLLEPYRVERFSS